MSGKKCDFSKTRPTAVKPHLVSTDRSVAGEQSAVNYLSSLVPTQLATTNTYATNLIGYEQFYTVKPRGRHKAPPLERLERSRERNRIHARRTRQRKKEQTTHLQSLADELKEEQLRLKQIITEKNTANILVCLFSKSGIISSDYHQDAKSSDDPRIEELLRRAVEDIPDSSQMTEILPPLILPGQNAASKKTKKAELLPAVHGIDYDLLGKDRSKCSAEELDAIRRERNRMHAKRTRDRKRMFMGSVMDICRGLEKDNDLLRAHLRSIDPDHEECQREPARTASAALVLTPTSLSKKRKMMMLSSFSEDYTVTSSSESSSPAHSLNLQPLGLRFSAATEPLDLPVTAATASSKPTPNPHGQSHATFGALLQAAMLEDIKKKRAYPAVSSDDSNDDDEAMTSVGITNKRARIVEL